GIRRPVGAHQLDLASTQIVRPVDTGTRRAGVGDGIARPLAADRADIENARGVRRAGDQVLPWLVADTDALPPRDREVAGIRRVRGVVIGDARPRSASRPELDDRVTMGMWGGIMAPRRRQCRWELPVFQDLNAARRSV